MIIVGILGQIQSQKTDISFESFISPQAFLRLRQRKHSPLQKAFFGCCFHKITSISVLWITVQFCPDLFSPLQFCSVLFSPVQSRHSLLKLIYQSCLKQGLHLILEICTVWQLRHIFLIHDFMSISKGWWFSTFY